MTVVPVIVLAAALYIHAAFTLFVIQPIGAVPEGRTLLIERTDKLNFVDSADGVCLRIQGSTSLLCRMAVLTRVANNSSVIARFPYSEGLYLTSTNGVQFDR